MRKHKFLTFLLSLLVATGLWVYAVTVVNPDDTLEISDIRVRVTGTSSLAADGLMLTSSDVQYVDVTIAGRRSDLKELNSSTLEAVANVSYIDKAGTYEVSWTLNPPATVASGDISLVGSSSNRITVQVSECWNREIPLEVEYTEGEPTEGYLCGETVLDEKYITVSGPSEEVGRIARAVVSVDLTGVNTKIDDDFSYRLLDENGQELTLSDYATVSSETVHLTIPVRPYKDVRLSIELIDGGGLTSADVQPKIELLDDEGLTAKTGTYRLSIRVTAASEEALAAVEDTLTFEADLAEIVGVDPLQQEKTYNFPGGVTVLDGGTDRIDVRFTVSVNETIETASIPLKMVDMEIINREADVDYRLDASDIEITLRGGREYLKDLIDGTAVITGIVDISNYDRTTKRCPVTFVLPDGYADHVAVIDEECLIGLIVTAVEPAIPET